jgi:hypothetical protein
LGDDSGKVFLPGLHDLWLERLYSVAWVFNADDLFAGLEDCLMNRCCWNVDVRELHVECHKLYSKQVEWLEEFVVDVFWEDLGGDDGDSEENEDDSVEQADF